MSKFEEFFGSFIEQVGQNLFSERSPESQFDYSSLPIPNESSIRLVRLDSQSSQEQLSYSMRAVSLSNSPRFTALSYTWQKQKSSMQMTASYAIDACKTILNRNISSETDDRAKNAIFINGQRHMVSDNLHDALLLFRKTRPRDEEYWIDALCINQRDMIEKTSQVQKMGRIYGRAHLVVLWLGTCKPEIKEGVAGLEALASIPPRKRPACPQCEEYFLPDFSTPTAGAGHQIAGLPVEIVAKTAFHLISRDWFKRTWILQEFLLAQQAVFFYGTHQISSKAILAAFDWIFDFDGRTSRDQGQRINLAQILAPHIGSLQSTLMAHEKIASGHRLTLREWLHISHARKAGDPRDLLFGGLSLIDPTCLRIQPSRLQPAVFCEIPQNSVPHSLTPKGLRRVLMADYTVHEREVWVNLAACLLSGPSSNYLDVLSWSARPPQEGLEQTGSRTGRLKSRAEMDPYPVPSWVPKLKDGPYPNTMTMKDSLGNAISASRDGSAVFKAGITASKPSPQISQNGAVLLLDAVALEKIEAIIPSSIFVSEILFDELPRFLESLAQLPHAYPVGNGTSFDAVATALCTLLTPQDSQGRPNSGIGNNMEQTSPTLLSSFDSRAPAWLCKLIVREVRIWVDDLRENMDKGTEKNKSTKKEQLQSLLSSYAHLSSKFPDLSWPQNMELGLAGTNKKISTRTTMNGGSQGERVTAALFSKFATLSEQGVDRLQEWFPSDKSESDKPNGGRREHWMYQDSDFPFVDRTQKTYSLSPKAQDFANALDLRLIYRNLFRTKTGLIGIGPNWLHEGDQVMIIHGAAVPYLFRSPDGVRKHQIQAMEKQLAEQEKERYLSRKENIAMLKEHICQLQSQIGSPGGWTLIGDTYIEGFMHGEALAGVGDPAFQRIAIV